MNKIGLFGDSFGEHEHSVDYLDIDVNNEISWIHNIGATSHAAGGTDIQYSLAEFEKHHIKYDQVIFILTEHNRITLFDDENNMLRYVGPGPYMDSNAKKANNRNLFELRDMWNALSGIDSLFVNNSWQERSILNYKLAMERIKHIRPDVKFLPAFALNDIDTTYSTICAYLIDIVKLEEQIMKWKTSYKDTQDFRIAHLTEESHTILTRLIKEWLATDKMFFDFNIKEFENIKPDRNRYDASRWNR